MPTGLDYVWSEEHKTVLRVVFVNKDTLRAPAGEDYLAVIREYRKQGWHPIQL